MWYSRKQLCDTLGRSGAWFSKMQEKHSSRFEELYKQGHRKEGNGNQYLYDDAVLDELKLFRVESAAEQATAQAEPTDNAQDSAQNAPEAPTSPVEPFCDSKSVIPQKTELDALQAKYDALKALYDAQAQTIEDLKADKQMLNARLDKAEQERLGMVYCLNQITAQNQLLLNPPRKSLFSRIFGKKQKAEQPQAQPEQAASAE